jgi:hypothetical protein
MALSPEKIQELLANKRTKGLYESHLNFVMTESDEPGFDPAEDWPLDFSNKSATTMYQGFRNAAEKLQVADQVEILQRDNHVFILVKSRLELALSPVNTNGNGAQPESSDTD